MTLPAPNQDAIAERLCFGTAQLGMAYGIANRSGKPSERQSQALLAQAFGLGIRALDTAPVYGVAEERIGRFHTAGRGARFMISTKLPALERAPGLDIERQVERLILRSLRRLRVDVLEFGVIHDLSDLRFFGRALVDALLAQRERGRLRHVGVSVYGPNDMVFASSIPELSLIQHPFNLLDRRLVDGGWEAHLRMQNKTLHVRSVLLQGLLTLDPHALPTRVQHARDVLSRLRGVLSGYGLAPIDVALPFALSSSAARVIVAADNPQQLEDLVATAGARLPPDLPAALATALASAPVAVIDPRKWRTSQLESRLAPQRSTRHAAATTQMTRSTS